MPYGVACRIVEFGSSTTRSWLPSQQVEAAAILSSNDVAEKDWWIYLLILVGITAMFRTLAILALARRARAFF